MLSKSAENLALQVSRISPDLICLDIYLQMLKIIGIETLVRELAVREVAHTFVWNIGKQNHRAAF
jgi:response regulator of citrate/malate metabolism